MIFSLAICASKWEPEGAPWLCFPALGVSLGTAFAHDHVPMGSNDTGMQKLPLSFEIIQQSCQVLLKLES